MIRTFPEHRIRYSHMLDGLWDFVTDPDDIGIEQQWYSQFPSNCRKSNVPGCWNNDIGLYDYEGVAWYRTWFYLPKACHTRLVFHSIAGQADIYLNGKHVGEHYGSFSPYEVIGTQLDSGRHELVVRVDNTHDNQTIPLERVDWFHYGGIFRSVELQQLPDVYIDRMEIDYQLIDLAVDVTVKVTLQSLSPHNHDIDLLMEGAGERYGGSIHVPAGHEVSYEWQERWTNIQLWDIGSPHLYLIYVCTDEDDYTDRIGFRTVEVRDGQICMNGKPVILKGVNRHEEHPDWGFAFPQPLMSKDLDIIQNLGSNAVRGSHYPNSKYWLDLLDERGIVFWEEIPLWQFGSAHMADPVVQTRALGMMEEMIRRDKHHPSIIFWSAHNECETSSQEGYAFTELLVNRMRELDNQRLITYATHKPFDDITMGLFDVIGVNQYYGWYQKDVNGFKTFLEELKAHMLDKGLADKPIIMAEFGGAGIFGDTSWEESRLFSEDYQSLILDSAIRIFLEDASVAGMFVWQFADIRSDVWRFRDRARGFNNKGIVNEYRKPKQAYRMVKALFDGG